MRHKGTYDNEKYAKHLHNDTLTKPTAELLHKITSHIRRRRLEIISESLAVERRTGHAGVCCDMYTTHQ